MGKDWGYSPTRFAGAPSRGGLNVIGASREPPQEGA